MAEVTSTVTPLFSTSASLREGGIFTVDKAGTAAKAGLTHGPVSLCDLAKADSLTSLTLVESNFVSFFMAVKNLKSVGCDLRFGLKLIVCEDIADKSEASFKSESKVVIFLRTDQGYESLIKLYSRAATDGFYYVPRLDWKSLKTRWSDHLILALPFYSSFIARNTMTFASIVPDLPAVPLVLTEIGQQMPYDSLLQDAVGRYAVANGCETEQVKSIYYPDRARARQWLTWRCVLGRASWDKPVDGVTSREFCWQAFKELNPS